MAACVGRVLGVCMSHCSGVVVVLSGYIYKKENKFGSAQRMTGQVFMSGLYLVALRAMPAALPSPFSYGLLHHQM